MANTEMRKVMLFNFGADQVTFPDVPDKLVELTTIIGALAPEKPVSVALDKTATNSVDRRVGLMLFHLKSS